MARITLVLDDALLKQIKKIAADEGRSVQDLITDLLRRALAPQESQPFRLNLRPWKGELQPGVDISDRNSLSDAFDQD
ncbi:MAG TPA: DUF6364 family protein [Terriglobales bacterium]|nr:DUF6364 family protein [Terriglobales bacterium]